MLNAGKCPKCEKVVRSAFVEPLDIKEGLQSRWRGVSFSCEHCRAVLSVGIDPIAIKSDIVKDLLKALGRGR